MQKFLLLLTFLFSFAIQAETITISDQNTMSLNGQVDSESMGRLMVKLIELNKIDTDTPIYLIVRSPGGSVYDGFDFIRYAKASKRPIHTVTIFAASMGFEIVESLGTRYVVQYSTLMSHRAAGGIEGIMPGPADRRYAHFLSHIKEQDEAVVKRTNGKFTLATYKEIIRDEYWANSTRAISDGFADAEVQVICDKSLDGNENQVVNMQLFSVNVEFSKCPMITVPLSVKPATNLEYIQKNNINVTKEFIKYLGF